MDKLMISVIVPVYNVEDYIEKCIDSILGQTYQDFELILVNDGSTDSSQERMLKYGADPRITIINKQNTGQSDSRYQGLLVAKGEYVYFVDSDDFIEKDALEILVQDVARFGSDMVYGRYRLVNEQGKELRQQSHYTVNTLHESVDIVKDSLCVKNLKASLCLKLIRRALLLQCYNERVRSLRINEDVLLSFTLSANCRRISFRNDIVYNVLQRKTSLSRAIKPQLITISDVVYNGIKEVLNEKTLFAECKSEYYVGYIKNQLYALAVAATHLPKYSTFHSYYSLLDENSLYFSQELAKNIKLAPLPYKVIYHIGKNPFVFYSLLHFFRFLLPY